MMPLFAGRSAPAMLAHQGGWDEILMIAVPVLVIAGLLAIAKRRVDTVADAENVDEDR